jgi:hypothetical protein
VKSITTDLVAYAALEGPSSPENIWFDGLHPAFIRYGYAFSSDHWADWVITREGFLLNDRILIEKLSPEYLVIGIGGPRGYVGWGRKLVQSLPVKTLFSSYLPGVLADLNPRIKGHFQSAMTGRLRFWDAEYQPVYAFIPELMINKIQSMRPGKGVLREIEFLRHAALKKGWRHFPFELPKDTNVPNDLIASIVKEIMTLRIDEKDPMMFVLIRPIKWNSENYDKNISTRWLEDWGTPLVPFNSRQRKKLIDEASDLVTELIRIRKGQLKKEKKGRH